MKKILGNPNQYYTQTNNAQVHLFEDYFQKKKMISCGPTVLAMALDISAWTLDVFANGEQPEDSILMILHNPANLELFKKIRDIDYDIYPPNEVPQLYPAVTEMIYQDKNVCHFKWGLTLDMCKYLIDNDICVMISGDFPAGGHFVLIVGYEDNELIFNDPYNLQWPDNNGYNRRMSKEFFEINVKPRGYRLEIYKNRGA
jgi:hypothetical protein